MKAKFLVACAALLMLLPLTGFSAAGAEADLIKAGKLPMLAKVGASLSSPQDYIEYASINDVNIHELYFSAILYEGTESCLMCHQETAESMLGMGHFRWQGKVENIVGQKGQDVGKNQLLNNFCIAVPTNEPRCTQCHTGYGYADKNYNFNDPANIDCLVCHDQSGTYAKAPKTAGLPEPGVDLNAVARSIALGGNPTIDNCIDCHAKAGGGDNVKHGDIAMNLANTTREYDVHMGTDGADLDCVACHGAEPGEADAFEHYGALIATLVRKIVEIALGSAVSTATILFENVDINGRPVRNDGFSLDDIALSAVPLPAGVWFLLAGVGTFAAIRRRYFRQQGYDAE